MESVPSAAGGGLPPERAVPVEFTFDDITHLFPAGPGGKAFRAIENVRLSVAAGSFTAMIGPSGCGKSTLLNLAAGLIMPSRGTVSHRGVPVTSLNPTTAYMAQRDTLLPWRTLEANVAVPLEIRGTPRRERKERVEAALRLVGLSGFAQRYPSQLSGGMQKRACLARMLIYEPQSMLMDEPFGPLDAQLRLAMHRDLLRIWERDRKTVLFVTHDLEEAIILADEVVVFSGSPGRILHVEKISFPRPRDPVALRGTREFAAVWERLWRLLEPAQNPHASGATA